LAFHFGPVLRFLHCCMNQKITAVLAELDLTSSQSHIMGYLARSEQAPCVKDLEDYFHLSQPSICGTLHRLEKKEFIAFRSDPQDRRCKRIYTLPKGIACHERMMQFIGEAEDQLVAGFTPEEKQQLVTLLTRVMENMGGEPHRLTEED